MQFQLNEEHIAFRDMAADFARRHLLPNAAGWDENQEFPIPILREAAQLGMAGIVARGDIGGAELTRLDAAIIFEQLAAGCVSTSAYLSIHNMIIKNLLLYLSLSYHLVFFQVIFLKKVTAPLIFAL